MSGASKDAEEFAQDWYAILECEVTATKEQINKAARKLAMKYHPDKTTDPEAPEKFLKVQKAKEILLDEGKRKTID
ncbi:DnaJ domain-containing protein, partial [Ochromonadaceae sp. CCMP2298]